MVPDPRLTRAFGGDADATYAKSSFSASSGACAYVRRDHEAVADCKSGLAVDVPRDAVRALVSHVRSR